MVGWVYFRRVSGLAVMRLPVIRRGNGDKHLVDEEKWRFPRRNINLDLPTPIVTCFVSCRHKHI